MKDSRLCAGDDVMMRWPEIRDFSWPEHAKMDLWPGIGRFLWPEKSPGQAEIGIVRTGGWCDEPGMPV